MEQEFNSAQNVYLDRDEQGIVRQLVHAHAPVAIHAATPQLVAADYLHQFGELLSVTPAELANLSLAPSPSIENISVEYRFLEEKRQFDSATVAYYQTYLGLPVWQAGVAIQMKVNPFRVLSAQSTLHPDLELKAPPAAKVKRAESIDEAELARLLGLSKQTKSAFSLDRASLKIEGRKLVIYRYETGKRVVPTAQAVLSRGEEVRKDPQKDRQAMFAPDL